MKLPLLAALLVVAGAGCATYPASRYGVSTDNVMTLREMPLGNVQIGPFTATQPGLHEIACRAAGPITVPDNETFANYVRKALVDELRMANKYGSRSPVVISGNLDFVEFSSTDGTWTVGVTLRSSNQYWVRESVRYKFETSFFAESACNATAQAFMPAVQDLIGKLIQSPRFAKMFPAAAPPPPPPSAAVPAPPPTPAPEPTASPAS